MTALGEKLRKGLKARRLSQKAVARALGTNQSQVSAWVNGVVPSVAFLFSLSKLLDLSLDYLLDDDVERPRRRLDGVILSPEEDKILWAARVIGYKAATDRLLKSEAAQPGSPPAAGDPQHPGRMDQTDERSPYMRPQRNGKKPKGQDAG